MSSQRPAPAVPAPGDPLTPRTALTSLPASTPRCCVQRSRTTRTKGQTDMDTTQVAYSLSDGIAVITLNRPEKLNVLSNVMKDELRIVWRAFVDDPAARVAILTGAGRAFCAGRDIKEHDAGETGNATVYEHESSFPMPRH